MRRASEQSLLQTGPTEPEGIASALAAVPPPKEPLRPRAYSVRDAAVVLAVFALVVGALDSESLVTWARRMEVGPVQSAWLSVLVPLHHGLERAGLAAPRKALVTTADRLSRALGGGDDPLLADAWATADEAPAPVVAAVLPRVEPRRPVPEPRTEAVGALFVPSSPVPDPDARLAEEPFADRTTTVLLLGDSLIGGSVGSIVTRALDQNADVRVVKGYQPATGLSRPDVFDWMRIVPPLLEREKPQLIICSLGANDAQRIREGEALLEFGEPEWRKVYSARVKALLSTLTASGAKVLWLGLPPMREPIFARRARALNALYRKAAEATPSVEYLEVEPMLVGPDGEYATFLDLPDGRYVRVRLEDGIHYAPGGGLLVAPWILDWVNERLPKR